MAVIQCNIYSTTRAWEEKMSDDDVGDELSESDEGFPTESKE